MADPPEGIEFPLDHYRHISPAYYEQLAYWLADEYDNGRSIRDLAKQTGRSYGAIRRMLINAGVTLKSQGGARYTVRPRHES